MALSDFYKQNCVWMTNYNTNGYDIAVTKTFEDLFPDSNVDVSVLLNNGSTFTQLNSGAKGPNPIVYPDGADNSLIGDYSVPVKYLGSALCISSLNGGALSNTKGILFNLTKKIGMNITDIGSYGWDTYKNWRFIVNMRPHKSSTSQGNPVDWELVDNWIGLRNFVIKPWYNYVDVNRNPTVSISYGRVNHYENIPEDRANSCTSVDYDCWLTNYDSEMSGTTSLTNKQICSLVFFFEIDGDIYLTLNPESCYPTTMNRYIPTYTDNEVFEYRIGIGNYMPTENTFISLPDSDDVKGWRFGTWAVSGFFRQCSCYVNTINAMIYYINSSGLRWMNLEAGIGTASDYRSDVRLGKMGSDGVVVHNEWIIGEEEIKKSDNPNKNGDYSNLPDRDTPVIDDNDDLALQLLGQNSQLAKFMHYYVMNDSEIEELGINIRSALVENPMQYLISLKEIPYYFERFISGASVKENIQMGPWDAASATGFRIQSSTAVAIIGSIKINRYFNNFLDYAPYTNISLYVPYCGKVELPVDIVMGKSLSVLISFDFESLNCVAMIFSDGAYITNIHGNVGKDYSVSATNGFLKGLGSALSVFETTALIGASFVNPAFALELPSSVVNTANSLSKNYSISKESSNDFTNFKAPQQCCLFMSRPRLEDLKGFKKSVGVRCEKFGALSTFSGLTVCRNPHINIECTDTEKDMIKQLLENGVIL